MSIDKHFFHNNIASNHTWIFGNFKLKKHTVRVEMIYLKLILLLVF